MVDAVRERWTAISLPGFEGFVIKLGSSECGDSALPGVGFYKWMSDRAAPVGGLADEEASGLMLAVAEEGGCRRSDHSLRLNICFVKEPG